MSTVTIDRLADGVGAEVIGVDVDQLLNDDSLPGVILEALEENGVLVFRRLGLDAATQVEFVERLGPVEFLGRKKDEAGAGISRVSLDPTKAAARTLRGAFNWHMDGCILPDSRFPGAASILTALALADEGGQTEFASTYRLHDSLTEAEKERLSGVRVVHTVAATQRLLISDPTPEQEAEWATSGRREHPLIWQHRSGRCSVVIGATTESVVGMDDTAGRALLDDLLARATAPERVYRHEWSIGDMVMWDNRGMLHRVEPYDDDSPREMIRTSIAGDEPIQ